jgi:hypothetical protein
MHVLICCHGLHCVCAIYGIVYHFVSYFIVQGCNIASCSKYSIVFCRIMLVLFYCLSLHCVCACYFIVQGSVMLVLFHCLCLHCVCACYFIVQGSIMLVLLHCARLHGL